MRSCYICAFGSSHDIFDDVMRPKTQTTPFPPPPHVIIDNHKTKIVRKGLNGFKLLTQSTKPFKWNIVCFYIVIVSCWELYLSGLYDDKPSVERTLVWLKFPFYVILIFNELKMIFSVFCSCKYYCYWSWRDTQCNAIRKFKITSHFL